MLPIWLIPTASVLLGLFLALSAQSEVDIDYSHTVIGRGTIQTEYQMTSPQTSAASGGVWGTGDLMNRYTFSTNTSNALQVEDKFYLSGPPVEAEGPKYPKWHRNPAFKFSGTSWAESIVADYEDVSPEIPMYPPDHANSIREVENYASTGRAGSFKFQGVAAGTGPSTFAETRVLDSELDVGASLDVGRWDFDYWSSWFNSSNVTVRSAIGGPGNVQYEENVWVEGNNTGRKMLRVIG